MYKYLILARPDQYYNIIFGNHWRCSYIYLRGVSTLGEHYLAQLAVVGRLKRLLVRRQIDSRWQRRRWRRLDNDRVQILWRSIPRVRFMRLPMLFCIAHEIKRRYYRSDNHRPTNQNHSEKNFWMKMKNTCLAVV